MPVTSDTIALSLNNLGMSVYNEFISAPPAETYRTLTGTPQTLVVVDTPGNDAITGVSSNELIGGDGHDALLGGAGDMTLFALTDPNRPLDPSVKAAGVDTADADAEIANYNVLSGGPGDTLWGGPGADFFVFGSQCGANIIRDFDPVPDQLVIQSNIDGSGITSFNTLKTHMADSPQGTVISFGSGDRVLLADVSMADLRPDDFAFR